ncbi:chloride channel protein [Bifidobacterium moukalabense]|uniref:chloride channel protein n=1 Tax=Bifidobacterium moukalabense TaxID=1333651 RepID=UPI0010F9CC15|nr:chloride channel protein [Bifidobacterium moukalabense]
MRRASDKRQELGAEVTESQERPNKAGQSQQPKLGRIPALVAAVAIVSVAIGAAAGLLTLMLYGIEQLGLGYVESTHESGPFHVPPLRRAISVFVGATIAAIIWWLLRTRSTKVPSVKKAVNGNEMPVWQTVVHVVLQIFIVGMGMSVGRETAPRELGAMFGQRFARWVHLDAKDTRTLVAATAAAGLAGVYNAPLAGTFFAVEILLADVTLESVIIAFSCSALAAWVASLIKGTHPFYSLDEAEGLFTPDYMAFALVAGLILGVAGALFRRGSQWAEQNKPAGNGILWLMPLAGVLTAIVAIWVPQVMGNGRATAQLSFSSKADLAVIPVLLLSFAAKAIVTLLTIRSGASGGVLQPGIALGAAGGAALGVLWMQIFHTNSIAMYALLGACALLSASQQAPLMAICLAMELVNAPINLFVPIGFAVAVSAFTSFCLNGPLARFRIAVPKLPDGCRACGFSRNRDASA